MIIYCSTVYNPDMSGKIYFTVDYNQFCKSGTKSLKYLVGTGDNGPTVYNPNTSGNFYCTAYYSLFYASGKKNLKYLVGTGERFFAPFILFNFLYPVPVIPVL